MNRECATDSGSACKTSVSNIIMLLSNCLTVLEIKLIFKCLLNSLLYFIGLLVIRNE